MPYTAASHHKTWIINDAAAENEFVGVTVHVCKKQATRNPYKGNGNIPSWVSKFVYYVNCSSFLVRTRHQSLLCGGEGKNTSRGTLYLQLKPIKSPPKIHLFSPQNNHLALQHSTAKTHIISKRRIIKRSRELTAAVNRANNAEERIAHGHHDDQWNIPYIFFCEVARRKLQVKKICLPL